MSYIEWTEDLSVNNVSIDRDHKRLVDIINKLYESMKKGEGSKVAGEILDELVEYTREHFSNEERIMMKHKYSHLREHQKEHDRFVEDLIDLRDKLKSRKIFISIEIMKLLKSWLMHHIKGTDQKLGRSFLGEMD